MDVDFIVAHLDAHYLFEQQRIDNAATNPEYNLKKRANDAYDSELLIYLADPSLHLLTCDTGFNRVKSSSQAKKIHIVPPDALRNHKAAVTICSRLLDHLK